MRGTTRDQGALSATYRGDMEGWKGLPSPTSCGPVALYSGDR